MEGKEFKRWRRINDITLQDVGKEIHIHYATISKWERNVITVSDEVIEKLVNYKLNWIKMTHCAER